MEAWNDGLRLTVIIPKLRFFLDPRHYLIISDQSGFLESNVDLSTVLWQNWWYNAFRGHHRPSISTPHKSFYVEYGSV